MFWSSFHIFRKYMERYEGEQNLAILSMSLCLCRSSSLRIYGYVGVMIEVGEIGSASR